MRTPGPYDDSGESERNSGITGGKNSIDAIAGTQPQGSCACAGSSESGKLCVSTALIISKEIHTYTSWQCP